ncbi:TonB-dependent siderophore receptor [Pseudomonas sp. LD120]|uniref:TonB-dependent alcaligin siderophore receptor FauA n=1 Tax=Pseudomonas sp. LD120 TaxID=485751 RepID=UPI001356BB8A|nr:TonB-dependent siderophore receptor [Pseudomonas sp. LD120]KAF0864319.1 TonB-dependent siderophore receptor [Pseudomonas sp. LD120]
MPCLVSFVSLRRVRRLPTALLGSLLASLSANAQEPDAEPRPAASLELPIFNVQGEPVLGQTTEDSGSYTTGAMSTAIGLPLSIKETPQSVSVITRQRIDDQGLGTTADILASAPGISYSRNDSNRLSFSARGFAIDNFQFDGLASPINGFWNFGATEMDSAIYDRVEVVRGSTGLLSGAGNPSAAVNFVRKRPLADFALSGSAGVGRWDERRGDIDMSLPLAADGRVAARVVAAYSEKDSYVTFLDNDSRTLYGVISAELTPRTRLTGSLEYQKNQTRGMGSGFPLFYSDGSRTDFGRSVANNTRWSAFATESTTAFIDLEHSLENDWKLRSAYSRYEGNYEMRYLYRGGYPDRQSGSGMRASFLKYDGERTRDDWHLTASGPFELLGRRHELGLGWMSIDDDLNIDQYLPAGKSPATGSFLDWRGDHIPEPVWSHTRASGDATHTRQTGGYLVTRLSLADPLHLILGARISDWNIEQNYYGTPRKYRYKNEITPYAGLVYDLDSTYSLYTSYTSIFNQQNARAANGSILDPVTGDSYEAGLKAAYLDGRLNAALAVYRTQQEGLAEAIPGVNVDGRPNEQAYKAGTGARVDGFDLDIAGQLTDQWNLSASYTHFIARNGEGRAINTSYPRTQFKLFTTYRLSGRLDRLTLGGGTTWNSSVSRSDVASPKGSTEVSQGAYALTSLMARYQINDNLSLTANLDNLFDKQYYEQIGFYSQGWWGEPRNLRLGLKAAF